MLQVQLEHWPVVVTALSSTLDERDVDTACRSYEAAFARGGQFVSLVDARTLEALPTWALQRTYAAWRVAHRAELREHVMAVAYALGERWLVRGALAVRSWFVPHPSPEAFFADYGEAMTWCRGHLLRATSSR